MKQSQCEYKNNLGERCVRESGHPASHTNEPYTTTLRTTGMRSRTKSVAEIMARGKVVELARKFVCEHQGIYDCKHFTALDKAVIRMAKLEAVGEEVSRSWAKQVSQVSQVCRIRQMTDGAARHYRMIIK